MSRCMRVAAILFLFASCEALAQVRPRTLQDLRQQSGQQRRPGLPGAAPRARNRVGTFYSNLQTGVETRAEHIRSLSRVPRRKLGLLSDPAPSRSPTRRILNARNLLRTRSPLGQAATALLGRVPDEQETELPRAMVNPLPLQTAINEPRLAAPSTMPAGPVERRSYDEFLAARLRAAAEENFETGTAYFRARDYAMARHRFEQAQQVMQDNPRPYLGDALASVELNDHARACYKLIQAFRFARSLQDLKLPDFINAFYEGEGLADKKQEFGYSVDRINLLAKTRPESANLSLLLSYYAWLNDDWSTAISTSQASAARFEEPFSSRILQFHDMLVEARDPPAKPAGQ